MVVPASRMSPGKRGQRIVTKGTSAPKRVAIYARSSRHGEEATTDLDRQEADCRERVAKHPGWVIEGVFRDAGTSAGHIEPGTRPAFDDLASSETGRFDIVVANGADRLARRPEDCHRLLGASDGPKRLRLITARRSR